MAIGLLTIADRVEVRLVPRVAAVSGELAAP